MPTPTTPPRIILMLTRGLAVALTTLAVTACVIAEPDIEATAAGSPGNSDTPQATAAQTPTSAPRFEPTATPAPVQPTPTPSPPPEPTSTPIPAGPPPLATAVPGGDYVPEPVEPGLVSVPVRGASFRLNEARPVLQFGGHTLIYLDDDRTGEVDIFTPVADRDGTTLDTYDAVINVLTTDPDLAGLEELAPVSIAGLPTRVFEGSASATQFAFITSTTARLDESLGWYPPARMRLWVIDHPGGAVIVSAESAEDPGRYSDAVRLATEVLSTIDFAS